MSTQPEALRLAEILDGDYDPEWFYEIGVDECTAELHRLHDLNQELLDALKATWHVLEASGLLNLSNGVQLGPTVWFVKACDAQQQSRAAIAKAEGTPQ